jgi:2-polyprenyl-6-methoxyphenol hydroxylase-like FAD-dependent oxidoreductase
MVGRFALHAERTLFLFVFASDGPTAIIDGAAQRAALRQKFADGGWECARILAALDSAESLYFDRVSQIRMAPWSRGRVALVGDAAFCPSLMAGQGSSLAITAAYVLAGELGQAGGRHEEAFRAYETRLRGFIAAKQKGAEAFASAFAPQTRWGLFLRNQVVRACAIPGLSRLAFGRDIVDRLKLPHYDWSA